jgi:hypothetical protein
MPEIFRESGFRFFFYSNDHEPVHVHVTKGNCEAVFTVLETEIVLKENYGMKSNELRLIKSLAEEKRELIIETWVKFFTK